MSGVLLLSLAVCCNALLILLLKLGEIHGVNRGVMLLCNYCTATAIGLWLCCRDGVLQTVKAALPAGGPGTLLGALRGGTSPASGVLWALLLGVLGGIFCFSALALMQKSVREDGAGIAGMFTKLGILVPVILSLIFWAEIPRPLQWLGIALAVVSVVFANLSPAGDRKPHLRSLLLLLLVGGVADFFGKFFQKLSLPELRALYLTLLYFTAALLSLGYAGRSRATPVGPFTLCFGVFMGAANYFANSLVIRSLRELPAYVAYPAYSAGVILLVTLAGAACFGEKLRRNGLIALSATIGSLILLNTR